jgi:predicted kinase
MAKLIVTRGLPASGKTTRAKKWVATSPKTRVRINRDDLRGMIHDGVWLGHETEDEIIAARNTLISVWLQRGRDVVCDDTNLPSKTVRDLRRLALAAGAEFEAWDLTNMPVDVCVERDKAREATVGEDVIRGLYARYIAGKPYPLPIAPEPDAAPAREPYVPPQGAPAAILCDLDGTIAHMHGRSPYPGPDGEDRCGEDTPDGHVIAAVEAMWSAGHEVVFMSGRTEACRAQTEAWLERHISVPYVALYMREVGDQRKDSEVKLDLFDQHVRRAWDVIAVFDDRQQVVDAWRSLGLTVLQCAPGNF